MSFEFPHIFSILWVGVAAYNIVYSQIRLHKPVSYLRWSAVIFIVLLPFLYSFCKLLMINEKVKSGSFQLVEGALEHYQYGRTKSELIIDSNKYTFNTDNLYCDVKRQQYVIGSRASMKVVGVFENTAFYDVCIVDFNAELSKKVNNKRMQRSVR